MTSLSSFNVSCTLAQLHHIGGLILRGVMTEFQTVAHLQQFPHEAVECELVRILQFALVPLVEVLQLGTGPQQLVPILVGLVAGVLQQSGQLLRTPGDLRRVAVGHSGLDLCRLRGNLGWSTCGLLVDWQLVLNRLLLLLHRGFLQRFSLLLGSAGSGAQRSVRHSQRVRHVA